MVVQLQESHSQLLVGLLRRAERLQQFRVFILEGSIEGSVRYFGVLSAAGGLAETAMLTFDPALHAKDLLFLEADILKVMGMVGVARNIFLQAHVIYYKQSITQNHRQLKPIIIQQITSSTIAFLTQIKPSISIYHLSLAFHQIISHPFFLINIILIMEDIPTLKAAWIFDSKGAIKQIKNEADRARSKEIYQRARQALRYTKGLIGDSTLKRVSLINERQEWTITVTLDSQIIVMHKDQNLA